MLLSFLGLGPARKKAGRLEQIYERYKQEMFAAARQITGSDSDAEDAVQEAFLSLGRVPGKLEEIDDCRMRAYLLAVVESKAVDICRRRTMRAEVPLEDRLAFDGSHSHAVAEGDALRRALDRLPKHDLQLLMLRYDTGLMAIEIAEVLDKSMMAVYKRLQRAKARLAEELKKEGFDIEEE